jgi:hypothetical protein
MEFKKFSYHFSALIAILVIIGLSMLRQYRENPTQAPDLNKVLTDVALFHFNRERYLNESMRNGNWKE